MDRYVVAAYALVFVLLIAGGIYLRVAAPCDAIDWLPVTEIPARCLR